MADLTMNTPRDFRGIVKKGRLDVGANVRVFVGQAMMAGPVGDSPHTGGIVNCASQAAADFVGFAAESVDNRLNTVPHGGAARSCQTDLHVNGSVWLDVDNGAAWTFDDLGLVVYATDGNTFTTSSAGNAVKIGKVADADAAVTGGANTGRVLVEFNAAWSSLLIV